MQPLLNLDQRIPAAAHQPLCPGRRVGTICRDGCWIRAVEGMGQGSSDGSVRDTEHRFLEADADLHMGIHLATTMVVVPLAQLLGEIAEHV